ncbi:leucine--tRNA ligase [Candidatus Woesearchaeota archaeon]|nr:leucine--tRNA ligase [Candidatus Woesearchaeota archaeon]
MVDHPKIETAWQKKWVKAELGASMPDKRKKFYMIFAYPGISGYMHVGHMRGYSYADAVCRYKRMTGHNVLFPVGTHASGNIAYAFLSKIQKQDADWVEYLKINGATDADIKKMKTTDAIIEYFNNVYINTWKRFGFLCDWDRFTSTFYPDYQRFIQWQFKRLNDQGLLVQKPYYATFCPEDGPIAVDLSETDISKGGNAEKQEYTLLKFNLNDYYLVAATLRPETVFGQTNLWINPDAMYALCEVGDGGAVEKWLISPNAAQKLAYQKAHVKVIGEISGRGLIGQTALAPMIKRKIPILPASFCDPAIGTGIVTCVPSDAPYDYMALRDLRDDAKRCADFGLDVNEVRLLKPMPIIATKGYGPLPAGELCKKRGIANQQDRAKLDDATKELYKAGHHTGVMTDTCGSFAGLRVDEAKEKIRATLIGEGSADVFYDLSVEVICRCGRHVVIKRIDDQWFIKYSDDALTQQSKHCATQMHIAPSEFKTNLPGILEWFSDRACTRLGNWIGTKLPFDDKWTIEPIADSTLYPLYYLVSPYVNSKQIKTEQLSDEVFDYVFLDKGRIEAVAKSSGVKKSVLEKIHKDVEYYYPLDMNLGGKEHQTVHFPVFIMNHVGLLPEPMWPRGIFTNAWVVGKGGGKVSKSKGGAGTLGGIIEKWGVDSLRLYYAHIGSPHTDVEWTDDILHNYKQAVDRVYLLLDELKAVKGKGKESIEQWILSRAHQHIITASSAFESYELREAATALYFGFVDDLKWYLRRGGNNATVIKDVLQLWTRMLCPITPHLAEEMWSMAGGKGLVSTAEWPTHDEKKIHLNVESSEASFIKLSSDVRAVIKLSGLASPRSVTLLVAEPWKYELVTLVKKQMGITRDLGAVLRCVMAMDSLKPYGQQISNIVPNLLKDPSRIPAIVTSEADEIKALSSACEYLTSEVGCAVEIGKAANSLIPKAGQAMPGKPAIIVS